RWVILSMVHVPRWWWILEPLSRRERGWGEGSAKASVSLRPDPLPPLLATSLSLAPSGPALLFRSRILRLQVGHPLPRSSKQGHPWPFSASKGRGGNLLPRDGNSLRTLEAVGTGDHDLVAFLQALQDLHLVDAAHAHADRRLGGDAVLDHVGVAAAGFVDEGAALHGEHVVALVEQDAHGQALVLAQLLRRAALEAHAGSHFAVHHLGRDRADQALPGVAVAADLAGHADREVAGEALGHLHFHFQRGEVDHAEQLDIL